MCCDRRKNHEKDLSPLRKRVRMHPFHRLLVRESATQRCHKSLFEGSLQRLPVQGMFGGNQWKVIAIVHSDLKSECSEMGI